MTDLVTHKQDSFLREGPNKTEVQVQRHSLHMGAVEVHGAPSFKEARRLLELRIHAIEENTAKRICGV